MCVVPLQCIDPRSVGWLVDGLNEYMSSYGFGGTLIVGGIDLLSLPKTRSGARITIRESYFPDHLSAISTFRFRTKEMNGMPMQ